MIRIEIDHTKNGNAIFTHNGHASPTLCGLARLILSETGDAPWQAGRPGKIDMHGQSIANLAQFAVSEGDKDRPRFRKYTPHPLAAAKANAQRA